ncbi:hypothetical protein QBC39DRAFT_394570 [Podospora conica]|nr:hypothetical protein QBC39DRAFT_394570 [Schizothecium conicum]
MSSPPFRELTVNPEGLLVAAITRVYYKYRIPIIPYSGSLSLEGNFSAPFGGINIIVQLSINYSFFFPIDLRLSVKVGGIIRTNYSGTNALSTGYNLNSLFIGSEGTLRLVTEVTFKLSVIPKEFLVAVVTFPSIRDTISAVAEIKVVNIGGVTIPIKAGANKGGNFKFTKDKRDYTIPFNKLADIIEVSKKEIDEFRLFTSILGYIRDRNFYEKKVEIYIKNIVKRALEIEGIYTSEYSIG